MKILAKSIIDTNIEKISLGSGIYRIHAVLCMWVAIGSFDSMEEIGEMKHELPADEQV